MNKVIDDIVFDVETIPPLLFWGGLYLLMVGVCYAVDRVVGFEPDCYEAAA